MSPSLRMRGCMPAVMWRSDAFCATNVCSSGSICRRPGANAGTGRVSERGNVPVCSVGGGGVKDGVVGACATCMCIDDCTVGGGIDDCAVGGGIVDDGTNDDGGSFAGGPGRRIASMRP